MGFTSATILLSTPVRVSCRGWVRGSAVGHNGLVLSELLPLLRIPFTGAAGREVITGVTGVTGASAMSIELRVTVFGDIGEVSVV